jgi:WD40 repeat protein
MQDSATNRVLWTKRHGATVYRCAFTRDDTLLATASYNRTVKLWRTTDGLLIRTLKGHKDYVSCVACSPVADVLLSGDHSGVVKVWDTATGAELHTLPRHPSWAMSVAFDARGALAATGCDDGQIRLFDALAGWQPLCTLQAHASSKSVWGLQFSTSTATGAPLLASGSHDCTATLWDVRDARQPRLLHTLTGHIDAVVTVSFSPDGALLATSGGDMTIKLWRVADGALVHTIAKHSQYVLSVAFHTRDAALLAACYEDRLSLWRL